MALDPSKLAPCDIVSHRRFELDAGTIRDYVAAVDDGSPVQVDADGGAPLAPPMAVAALMLRGVVNDLALPGGTLHTGQEMEFLRTVRAGDELDCTATVAQSSVRGGRRFVVFRLAVENGDGQTVLNGTSTLMVPEE
jgi:acyl dehydratase